MTRAYSYSTSLQEIARDIRLQKIGPKVVAEKLEALALAMNANSGRELPEGDVVMIPLELAQRLNRLCLQCCPWSNLAAEAGDDLASLLPDSSPATPLPVKEG